MPKIDTGLELLKVLKVQRQSFIRLANGEKLITNQMLYRQMEDESYRLQMKIGSENKKLLNKK